ncbi:MAG TPA: M15 family metallopeptidase [Candidatus Paceibacterota bacterium]|nr:M15 family metallopeptidase [Candidatus Paceibacterota bacterium]
MLEKINGKINYKILGIDLAILLVLCMSAYIIFAQFNISSKISKIENDFDSVSESLEQKILNIEEVLIAAKEENLSIADALQSAEKKSESLAKQFDRVNRNVDELDKITRTDKELLQKYSKVYFLNEHYAPIDLRAVPSEYGYDKNRKYEVHIDVWPYLRDLLDDASDDGLNLLVISAFRSFHEQAILKGAYTVTYGAGTANQFSADQGYSEHQLGTTVDFTNPTVGATFSGFARSPEYAWLLQNAHKYGFTLSYPENNSYYQFEPWHWRFVGIELATYLFKQKKFFYDLTQREIDDYIIYLFD